MDLSQLTPEQVAQLRAILLPEFPTNVTASSVPTPFSSSLPLTQTPAATPAPSSFFSSLLPPTQAPASVVTAPFSSSLPPSAQAPANAPVPQRQSVRFLDTTQTAAETIPHPITQLYQSRQQSSGHPSTGHPNTPSGPSSFQPFLGISNLGVGFAAGHANQARRASAATTLPRQPTLSRRTSRSTRTRGTAIQPPSIPVELAPGTALHLRSCFLSGTPEPVVRLTVKVYPPLEHGHRHILFRFLRESFDAWLESHNLLYQWEVPTSTLVRTLLLQVKDEMVSSSSSYRFTPVRRLGSGQEGLPLEVLGVLSRGQPSGSANQVYMRPYPVDRNATIAQLVADRHRFSPQPCIDGNRIILHLVVSLHPLTLALSNSHRHQCLGRRLEAAFPHDGYSMAADPDSFEDDCRSESSDDGIMADDDSDDLEEVQSLAIQTQAGQRTRSWIRNTQAQAVDNETSALAPSSTPAIVTPVASSSSLRAVPRDQSLTDIMSFISPEIWLSPWTAPPVPTAISYTGDDFDLKVYREAVRPNFTARLRIHGGNVAEMASILDEKLAMAVDQNDFSEVLSPGRDFQILNGNETFLSAGPGIEREVLYTAFESYQREHSQWFETREDGMVSVKIVYPMSAARFIPHQRLISLTKLGALCALLLITGQCPSPLDPCILQYATHNSNIHSLHPAFVGEWHPEIRAKVLQWLDIGSDGDITPFQNHLAAYNALEISSLQIRDEKAHRAFAADMLYRMIFGPEPPYHPEWKAFYKGFSLPCRNGFTFLSVPGNFEGGSETFFSMRWTSSIRGYDSVEPHLSITAPGPSLPFSESMAMTGRTFFQRLEKFLQSSGLPCPELFKAAQGGFSSVIDLSQVSTTSFRARVFVWAVTGSPFIDSGADDRISIIVSEENDSYYAESSDQARIMMSHGKISFRTCSRTARFPAEYITRLAQATYPPVPGGEPASFDDAFDHWLLCELLNAIGGHSIL